MPDFGSWRNGRRMASERAEKERFAAEKTELRNLELRLGECRAGLSRLERCREFFVESSAAARRWREQLSEPIDLFPGGKELREEAEAESEKASTEFWGLYDSAKAEYLEKQKELEDEMDVRKKRMASSVGEQDKSKGDE